LTPATPTTGVSSTGNVTDWRPPPEKVCRHSDDRAVLLLTDDMDCLELGMESYDGKCESPGGVATGVTALGDLDTLDDVFRDRAGAFRLGI
jgi:hypothetical protein